jgi:hypothetical protein
MAYKVLDFRDLREANVRRCAESYHPVREWSGTEWLMCVTGELGELAHELKRLRRKGATVDSESMIRIADERRRML